MASPYIRHVHSKAEVDTLLSEGSVVVSFYASWSAPCRKIAPVYSRLAAKHRSLTFVKVEISEDNIHSVAQKCRLITLPTFIIVKGENEVGRVQGVDQKGLEDMIAKHAPEATLTAGAPELDAIAASDESLLGYLDMRKVNCLNEAQHHTLKSIVEMRTRNTTEAYLESDADEQLLISLPFNQEVKVRSLVLYTKDSKFGPKKIKIVTNSLTLGFSDVESALEPAVIQVLEVPEEAVEEARPIHLRFVRMQHVNSLHIFVESNHGNKNVTRIDAIDVYGPGYGELAPTTRISGLRDFMGTHQRGVELLELFQREGGNQILSNALALFRVSALLCPVGHGQRAVLAVNLTTALLTQYVHRGDYADLSESITLLYQTLEICPPGHPHRPGCLNNLSSALQKRYERDGSVLDLEERIEKQREALNLLPVSHRDRAILLNNLAGALQTRYEREGGQSDLEDAIETYRGALELQPVGHPGHATALNNLAAALQTRCEHEGGLSALEDAIEKHRQALNLRAAGHPGRAESLCNLAAALHNRYEFEGSMSDLEESIGKHREALNLRPAGNPDRATSLINLAAALQTRYEREGSVSDLDEAIEKYRESLKLHANGHPARAASLGNLATGLYTRYGREGSLSDLEEAIEKHREALNLRPVDHPDRAPSLNNLATALGARYEHEGNLSYMEEATEKQREALNLYPIGHPNRATSLSNLAAALGTLYKRDGSLSYLEDGIEKQREALKLLPVGHPAHVASLNHLAADLQTRYERQGAVSDLEEAIEKHRATLELCPDDHRNRSLLLHGLSRAYLLKINRRDGGSTMHDHRAALVDEMFTLLREAVNHSGSPPLHRLRVALDWVGASLLLAPESALDAYNAALDQLDIALATMGTLTSKHSQLSSNELARCHQLGVKAACCAIQQGNMTLAVEFLERGRNLLFAQIGRYRVELDDLQKENAELTKRFSDLSCLLDLSVMSNQPTLKGRTAFEDPATRYRRVASDWDQAVNDIRAVPGFENFLRPPHYPALRAAAAEGPVIIVIPDSEQSHALIVLQDRDTPHYVNLPKASRGDIVTLCKYFFMAVLSDDEEDADSRITTLLRSLWVRVVGPIADALENEIHCPLHSRIWWCPSSDLSILPLHAAGRYTPNADPNQNLPAKYVSSYTSTLRALSRAQSKHSVSTGESMLIVAQPDTPGQGPLPNTIPEAEIVKSLVGAKMMMKTTLLSSKEGTHSAVLNGMINHSWIHLTCHGSQNFVDPFESCFCLYDYRLTLRDVMQRGLPDAKFAFLAACHTATGDFDQLDEGLHLAAGLQFAGFKSVVGTIWQVADIDGPVIAEAFYKALQPERVGEEGIDCRGAAHALSRAVQELRDKGTPISRWIRYIHFGI